MTQFTKRIMAAFSGVKAAKLQLYTALEELERLAVERRPRREDVQPHEVEQWLKRRLDAIKHA